MNEKGNVKIKDLTPVFTDSKIINVIQSKDQQLVDFEKVIKEFISREDKETKIEFANYLE